MKREIVRSGDAPAAIGPYSQAVKVGGLVFASGQIPLDPESGELVAGGIEPQVRRAIENLRAVLEAAGAGIETTVKVTLFLLRIEDFAQVNEVYAELFRGANPARSCVAVAALPRGAAVEIEAVAVCRTADTEATAS